MKTAVTMVGISAAIQNVEDEIEHADRDDHDANDQDQPAQHGISL